VEARLLLNGSTAIVVFVHISSCFVCKLLEDKYLEFQVGFAEMGAGQ